MRLRAGWYLHCATLIATVAGVAGSQQMAGLHPAAAVPMPVLLDTGTLFRAVLAKIGDDLMIAGQPSAQALRDLKQQGVTTIVNLRSPEEMTTSVPFDEAALVSELGMTYVYLPVRGTAEFPYAPRTVAQFTSALKASRGKVLLHCTIAWRASHLWAAYLIQERGMPVATALQHGRRINLMDEHHMSESRQPIEEFLDRTIPELRRSPEKGMEAPKVPGRWSADPDRSAPWKADVREQMEGYGSSGTSPAS